MHFSHKIVSDIIYKLGESNYTKVVDPIQIVEHVRRPDGVPANYIPLPDKFICFCTGGSPAAKYPYYEQVIKLLKRFLDDYEFIEIGEENLRGCTTIKADIHKESYILDKADVAVCNFNEYLYLPSKGRKVSVIANVDPKSFFVNSYVTPDSILTGDEKPCYSTEKGKSSIAKISPSHIAQSIISSLGKSFIVPRTKFIGKFVEQKVVEIIPKETPPPSIFDDKDVIKVIRIENESDIGGALQILSRFKSRVFTTSNVKIDFNVFAGVKQNLEEFIFRLDDNFNIDQVDALHRSGINYSLITALSDYDKYKIHMMDYDLVTEFEIPNSAPEGVTKDCFFETCKYVVCGHNLYKSYAHYLINDKSDSLEKVFDNPRFWADCEYNIYYKP